MPYRDAHDPLEVPRCPIRALTGTPMTPWGPLVPYGDPIGTPITPWGPLHCPIGTPITPQGPTSAPHGPQLPLRDPLVPHRSPNFPPGALQGLQPPLSDPQAPPKCPPPLTGRARRAPGGSPCRRARPAAPSPSPSAPAPRSPLRPQPQRLPRGRPWGCPTLGGAHGGGGGEREGVTGVPHLRARVGLRPAAPCRRAPPPPGGTRGVRELCCPRATPSCPTETRNCPRATPSQSQLPHRNQ